MTTGTPTLGLWLKWMVTFLGFPIGGGVAYLLVRSMEGIAKPTIGGLVTGLVLGVAQWIVLRQVMALSGWWIVATGIGLAAGLALSVALSGTSIELRPLIVRAVLTGCLLGIVADIGLSRGEVGPWTGMFGGATFPWTLGVSALLGVWLMASPDIFKSVGGAADSDHLLGALVVVVAITAMAEVGRAFASSISCWLWPSSSHPGYSPGRLLSRGSTTSRLEYCLLRLAYRAGRSRTVTAAVIRLFCNEDAAAQPALYGAALWGSQMSPGAGVRWN